MDFRISVLILFALIFPLTAFAQHCPFDGSNMVLVRVTDKNGPVKGAEKYLKLVEVDNPRADSCKYAVGLGLLSFKTGREAFENRFSESDHFGFQRMCPSCKFKDSGYYGVMLDQAREECMIEQPNSSDFTYIPRKYEIQYANGIASQNISVPKDRIYSMCTGYGSWDRMSPIEIKAN